MNRDNHKKLYDQYIAAGGDAKKVHLYKSFNLANHAKLKYYFKQINATISDPSNTVVKTEERSVSEILIPDKEKKSIFSDLITNYPRELHKAFKERYDHWLEVCSLKILLNDTHYSDHDTAYDIQEKMIWLLEKMDRCQYALDHYRENKRIMEFESQEDFSKLTPMQLIKKRISVRSSLTKRNSTLKRMEENLPDSIDPEYKKKLHQINRKKEQIRELDNILQKLEELIS